MDIPRVLRFLVPAAEFVCRGEVIEWLSPEPQPTQADLEAAWPLVLAEEARQATREAIIAQLAENDATRGVRAISDALAGDTTRLDALRADQAALRAQLASL